MNFVEVCAEIVGEENIDVDVTLQAVSGEQKVVPAIVRPASTNEVQRIVRMAELARVPIYPVSTGRSWGMGSTLPPHDDCVVVSLERMNNVRKIGDGYAVIEAGVTQGALADQLSGKGFFLDATGSGRHTSVLGCALDRGVAYNSHRSDTISGLEVVLGNGRIINTGFGHYDNAIASPFYSDGIGPSLDGLFMQSNFGVVTAATVRLQPVADHHCCFIGRIADDQLTQTIERLDTLKRKGIISCVPHIANRARTMISLAPAVYEFYRARDKTLSRKQAEAIVAKRLPSAWSMIGSLSGTLGQVLEGTKAIWSAMRGIGGVVFVNETILTLAGRALNFASFVPSAKSLLAFVESSQEVFGMTKGLPSNSALRSVYWPVAAETGDYLNPDSGEAGLLYCLPIIPTNPTTVQSALTVIKNAAEKYGFEPYITLNLLEGALEGVVNIAFDRRQDSETNRAHCCINEMLGGLAAYGIYPYRVGISQMSHVVHHDSFWETVLGIKHALDPKGIIAPRRYSLE
jgi:4-cresol dehydrogenase (hydroxylating)